MDGTPQPKAPGPRVIGEASRSTVNKIGWLVYRLKFEKPPPKGWKPPINEHIIQAAAKLDARGCAKHDWRINAAKRRMDCVGSQMGPTRIRCHAFLEINDIEDAEAEAPESNAAKVTATALA